MSHSIYGLIAEAAPLRAATRALEYARVIPLPQDLAFLPITDRVREELEARSPDAREDPVISKACSQLRPACLALALGLSREMLVAWIETDYFGGSGTQSAVAFHEGAVVAGPSRTGDAVPLQDGAINQVLRRLGVVRGAEIDEFDALRLGRCRNNDDWRMQPAVT